MAKGLDAVLDTFVAACDDAIGPGYSAVLFGSAARGEHVRGRSDLNLLLVLRTVTPDILARLGVAFRKLKDGPVAPPILISRDEWAHAADAFPIEITDMRSAYRLLRGDDPLAGIEVAPADLRRALERELRGKLLQLRRGYVALHDDERALGQLATESISSVLLLLRAALSLLGDPPPRESAELIRRAADRMALDPAPLLAAVQHRGDEAWPCPRPTFDAYLGAVEAAARFTDLLLPGGTA